MTEIIYRVSKKEYTRLMNHNTAPIASVLKIRLGSNRNGQNGERVSSPPPPPPPPLTLKSRFQTWNFPKQGMGRSSKDSRQHLHLRRNTRSNLSTFRRTFNFSFGVYVGGRRAVVVQTLFIILLRIWDVARTKSIYISTASL